MKRITGLLVLFFGFQAQAGFMVEPFVGYDMSANKITDTSAVDQSSKSTGTGYGALLGYRFPNGVSVAAEYAGGAGKVKDNSGQTTKADFDYVRTMMGAVVGYDHGMWRAYAGYGFSDSILEKADPNDPTSVDSTISGTSFKLGVGIMPIHHFSVNLQYSMPKYTKIKSSAITAISGSEDLSSYFTKFDTTVTSVTLSFPFDFGGK